MQMISATRLKKSQAQAENASPYSEAIYKLVTTLTKDDEYQSVFMTPRLVKKIAIVVLGATKGFVGSLSSTLAVDTLALVKKLRQKYPEAEIFGVGLNRHGLKVLKKIGLHAKFQFEGPFNTSDPLLFSPVISLMKEDFVSGEADLVILAYSKFISAIKQESVNVQLLPVVVSQEKKADDPNGINPVTLYEPGPQEILEYLIPEFIENQLINASLQSNASEHASRFVAMKNATDNADEIIGSLNKTYNKSRQSSITQSMLEIVGGSLN